MEVRPVKAIPKGPRGEVLVHQEKCIGRHICGQACPYHVPKFSDPAKQSYFGDKKSHSTLGPRPENVRTEGNDFTRPFGKTTPRQLFPLAGSADRLTEVHLLPPFCAFPFQGLTRHEPRTHHVRANLVPYLSLG